MTPGAAGFAGRSAGRDPWVLLICCARVFLFANFMVLAATLPVLMPAWGIGAARAGSIITSFTLAYALSLFATSWLADHFGAKRVALASAWGWDRLRGLEHASRSRFGILVAATSCMMGFGAVDFYFDDLAAWMTQSGFGRPFYNRTKRQEEGPDLGYGLRTVDGTVSQDSSGANFLLRRVKQRRERLGIGCITLAAQVADGR